MWAVLRSRSVSLSSSPLSPSSLLANRSRNIGFCTSNQTSSSSRSNIAGKELLNLQEIEKVLNDVKADNVEVIPIGEQCDYADFMVIATGRSTWHVKNIAQALVYQAKQKQQGAKRLVLPSVEGQDTGKWIVIDSGRVIVHALDEKARAYYDLENLGTTKPSPEEPAEVLAKAFEKVRRINNSKKRPQSSS